MEPKNKNQRRKEKSVLKRGSATDDADLNRLLILLAKAEKEDRENPWRSFRRSLQVSIEEESEQPNSGDFHTLNIEALERKAQNIKDHMKRAKGAKDYLVHELDEVMSQYRQLRDLLHHSQKVHEEVGEFLQREFTLFPKIFLLSQHGDEKMINNLATLAQKYCKHLAFLASLGDSTAIAHVSHLAILTTKTVNSLAEAKTIAELKEVAKNQLAWPLMVSSHPFLGSNQPDWEKLGLGRAFPFKLDAKRRFRLDTEVGKIAWKLWLHIFTLKNEAEAFLKKKHIDVAKYRREKAKTPRRNLLDEIVLLPTAIQTQDDVAEWWKVAKRCLVETFPDSQNPDRLNVNVETLNKLVNSASHRKSEEKLRSRILSKLSEQFDSLAGFGGPKRKKGARISS